MIKKLFLLMIDRVRPVESVNDVLCSLSDEVDRLQDIENYHQDRIKELRSTISTAQAEIEESERERKRASSVAEKLIAVIVKSTSVIDPESPTDANS